MALLFFYLAASENNFAGKRSSYVLCSGSEPTSCVRSQYQTPNHVTISGKNSISSSIQSPTSVNNSDGATPDNARSKKVKLCQHGAKLFLIDIK